MKTVKITYERVFPLAPYVNEKIGVEMELGVGDIDDQVFLQAKSTVERWHKESNPLLFLNPTTLSHPELPVIQKKAEEEFLPGISVNDILSCGSLVVLDAYKGIIRDNEFLMEHYNTRRAQLINESK